MNKPIMIVGQPRTGSTSVAKMMQELGMFIGNDFMEVMEDGECSYEDQEFVDISHAHIQKKIDREEFLHRLEERTHKRNHTHDLWGFKDPRAYKMIEDYKKIVKPRFIRTHRPVHKCMESMMRVFGWSNDKSYKTYNAINYILDAGLEGEEVLNIYIEDLINQTAMSKLKEYIYG